MKKVSTTVFLFIAIVICKPNFLNAQVNTQDSLALVDFYNSTDGAHWKNNTNWLTSAPVSTWAGISTIGTRVKRIDFYNNNLNGSLPASLGNLNQLTYLSLENNQLSDTIPSSFSNLTHIVGLDLSFNLLSGNLPSFLSQLENLSYLDLNNNQFDGTIPSSFGNFLNLSDLNLQANNITGNIPSALGNLHSITVLNLSGNHLTGTIPSSLANFTKILILSLNSNNLTGSIPPTFGNLSLNDLSLDYNHLSGKIPVNFRNIKAYEITLNNNNFTFAGMDRAAQKLYQKVHYFFYYQQANINIHKTGNKLSVSAGGELEHNTYSWFRNGKLYAKKRGDSTLNIDSNGKYYVMVKNFNATQLILYSDTINYSAGDNLIASKMNNNSSISIYPNPAKTNPTLSFYADGKYIITVTNLTGKTLQTKTGIANKGANIIQIDVSNYASGMYLITIVDEKNRKQTVRLDRE